jgi:hypothetical protein
VNTGYNTGDARTFIITASGLNNTNPVRLSDFLLNSFEAGDQRKANGNWINSITLGSSTLYYPFKYKVYLQNSSITTTTAAMTEYLMVLRLGEQYLIRAEARAQQGNISGAQSDLNAIRTRGGLSNTTASTQPALLTAILRERQVELFSEWGHRWFDLKRTENVDAVMSTVTPQKSSSVTWESFKQLFPLPFLDLQRNVFLVQNNGY